MIKLQAYNFNGGGACPTQFFWNNKDKTKFYYFRYRNGHWFLKEGPEDIETCDYDKFKIIAEGYEGDFLDGFCTERDFKAWLRKEFIKVDVINRDY